MMQSTLSEYTYSARSQRMKEFLFKVWAGEGADKKNGRLMRQLPRQSSDSFELSSACDPWI